MSTTTQPHSPILHSQLSPTNGDTIPTSTEPFFQFSNKSEDLLASGWDAKAQSHAENLKGQIVALTDSFSMAHIYADDTLTPLFTLHAWVRGAGLRRGFTRIPVQHYMEQYLVRTPERGKPVAGPAANRHLFTGFTVDAPMKDRIAFQIWWRNEYATEMATTVAENYKTSYLADLRLKWDAVVHPATPQKGSKWRVISGRKWPKGKVGTMFWNGSTRFGPSFGLAWSDKRGPDGKFTDVGFINPANLEFVVGDAEAKELDYLKAKAAIADTVRQSRYTQIHNLLVNMMPDTVTAFPHGEVNTHDTNWLQRGVKFSG